LFLIGCI